VAKTKLSIIILSYNTKDLLMSCLDSLKKVKDEVNFEVIVVDNASSDGSPEVVAENYSWVKLVKNKRNLGFAAGNNAAKNFCRGEYILFLNSDTLMKKNTLRETLSYLDRDEKVGAMTCKILLSNGKLDKDARRSFPTPWTAFTHFSNLDRFFPHSRLFARYWYG